jgi:hemerythrin
MKNQPEGLNVEPISWKPEYSTGNSEIDLQHQYFLQLIHRLRGELKKTGDKDYHTRLFWELNKFVEFHFQSEENIMRKAGVEGLDQLIISHEALSKELGENMQSSMMGLFPPEEIISFLLNWFIIHTVDEDKKTFASGKG